MARRRNQPTSRYPGLWRHGVARGARVVGAAAVFFAACGVAFGASVPIPNANFALTTNVGSVGGGLLGGSGNAVIGAGPWRGDYGGVLGLLAPPVLTIGPGHATVGGLAGINVLGILNNRGAFEQDVGIAFAPYRRYVLRATIDAGRALDVGLLNTGNAGLAIVSGNTVLASTASASPQPVSLVLLSGTSYQVTLQYDTGAVVNGTVGVRLLSEPQGLVTASLLSSISFGDVSLSSSALSPVAATLSSSAGSPQGTPVNAPFPVPLTVVVLDSEFDPVPNVAVNFSAPLSGASASLSAPAAVTA